VIEISDKAIRASENNAGAFVNLLNAEMDGLIKASTFNLGRMLFGNGKGVVSTVLGVTDGVVIVDEVQNFIEGMPIDFRDASGNIIDGNRRVQAVDNTNKLIMLSGEPASLAKTPIGTLITVQGSYNNEITGLGTLFDYENPTIYGLDKFNNSWLNPYILTEVGEIDEMKIQSALDNIEANSGQAVNFIMCSWGVRRALLKMLSQNKRTVDTMELAGGFKALSYNGIPIVVDRFCPRGNMYLLNTNDFALHQLCDWQWLTDDDGKVLHQLPGKPVYSATLVKYADLICSRPNGQGLLSGITEA